MTVSTSVFHMFATSPGGVNLQQLNICTWDAAGNCAKTTVNNLFTDKQEMKSLDVD